MNVVKNNKPFFLFLLKFGLSYLLLSVIYWFYLNQFDTDNNEPDSMTAMVARQAKDVVLLFGNDATIKPHPKEASYLFYVKNKSVARIVEGCNAASVMILFMAFIVAFSTTFKRTFIYIVAGIFIIHILNVIRVGLLSLGFYYYPDYKDLLHDILFPLFIYGVVFALWVAWVIKFSGNAKKNSSK